MLNRFVVAISAIAVAILIFVLPVMAQVRGAGAGARGAGAARFAGSGVRAGGAHVHRGRSFGRGSLLLPYPYYSDYEFDSQEPAPPQVVMVPAAAPVQTPPATPLEPLLIEWQGDHFERMTLTQKASAAGQHTPDYSDKSYSDKSVASSSSYPPARAAAASGSSAGRSSSSLTPRKTAAPPAARELPPAVLVFRDGRTEEVSDYTIMSGTIYSKADYWTSGSWTRKIQIADLDVPATLKQNQERGLSFVLPSGPNEVVMRP
ncbi:MAG TPA: hypothetical protein VNV82_24860 [Bryobacteraceae bacterium]|nr:hypothetical protein [Bryobacteraceae bacterium]